MRYLVAPQVDLAGDFGHAEQVHLPEEFSLSRRVGPSRVNDVDPDPELGKLYRRCSRQLIGGCFRHVIGGGAGMASKA